jgi:hypothetical protein
METNKNAKKARVLKALSIFMLIIMAMNFIMAYMVARHSSGKELDRLREEVEALRYELKLAKEENDSLSERITSVEVVSNTNKKMIVGTSDDIKKTWGSVVKPTVPVKTEDKPVPPKKDTKPAVVPAKKEVKPVPVLQDKKDIDIKKYEAEKFSVPSGNTKSKHIEFAPKGYKDVETDIIRGTLKIPDSPPLALGKKKLIEKKIVDKIDTPKDEEEEAIVVIEEEETPVQKPKSNKIVKYDIIIAKAKSYGTDVSYLDYEFLDYVFEEADKYNVNPYVILGIISGESNFYARAKNKKSSATGLAQMVEGTGKYIHTTVLGYKTPYNHESQKDPRVSIKYMLGYFKYLKKYNSYDSALGEYCGSKSYYSKTYRNKLVNNMVALGLSKAEADAILRGQIV